MLQIRDLSKTYPDGTEALKRVCLDVPRGMFGLLGPNGAGKSTLMRIVATLQDPDDGSIHLGDLDLLREKEAVRRSLGYLPQTFDFYPHARAERLLDHFAILKGLVDPSVRREVVHSLLTQTHLFEARTKKLGAFSGGMRQRFGVAVALLSNPRLIVVDEPTAGLDPVERVRFLNLLGEIGRDSVVILSTHIVEDVEELCTRMAIIDRGEILQSGEPTSAIDALRGTLWQKEITRDELVALERESLPLSTQLSAGRTTVRVHAAAPPGSGYTAVAPTLKDVYFHALATRGQPALGARA